MESLILENRIPRIISHPVIVRFDRYASNRPGGDEKSGISEMDRGRGGGIPSEDVWMSAQLYIPYGVWERTV